MPRNPRNPGQVRGDRHGAAKLSERAVLQLRARARIRLRGVRLAGLVRRAAVKLGVAPSAVSNAIHGVTWAHLPGAVKRRLPQPSRRTSR